MSGLRKCQLYVENRLGGWYYWDSYKERAHARQAAADVCSFFNVTDLNWKIEDGGVSVFRPEGKKSVSG